MEMIKIEMNLPQAQRFRALTNLATNVAGKLSKPQNTDDEKKVFQSDLRKLIVELAKSGAGDRKLFEPFNDSLNTFIDTQSKIEGENRKQLAEKRKSENLKKQIESLNKKITDKEEAIKNPKNAAKIAKLNEELKKLRESLTKAKNTQNEVKTAQTKQPNGMGEKSGN